MSALMMKATNGSKTDSATPRTQRRWRAKDEHLSRRFLSMPLTTSTRTRLMARQVHCTHGDGKFGNNVNEICNSHSSRRHNVDVTCVAPQTPYRPPRDRRSKFWRERSPPRPSGPERGRRRGLGGRGEDDDDYGSIRVGETTRRWRRSLLFWTFRRPAKDAVVPG